MRDQRASMDAVNCCQPDDVIFRIIYDIDSDGHSFVADGNEQMSGNVSSS